MQPQSWEEMLQAFRALGGIAENIRLDPRDGGLVPTSQERPVLLRVPESLLFPLDTLEFSEGSLRLKQAEDVSRTSRSFFEQYERTFGHLIHAQAASTVAALDSLSAPVKEMLTGNFGMRESFQGDRARRIESRVLDSRTIQRGEGRVLAPVLELARHGADGLMIQHDKDISIAGPVRDRIHVFHPFQDAVAIFQRYGFAAAQPVAFSLPMSFVSDGVDIAIERKLHLGDRRGDATIPRLDVVARHSLELSHLMLGHSRLPRLARGVFRTRMRDAGLNNPDEDFDRIARENTARLLKLLEVLEQEEGTTVHSLKRMALHQLEAMSWAIGAREI